MAGIFIDGFRKTLNLAGNLIDAKLSPEKCSYFSEIYIQEPVNSHNLKYHLILGRQLNDKLKILVENNEKQLKTNMDENCNFINNDGRHLIKRLFMLRNEIRKSANSISQMLLQTINEEDQNSDVTLGKQNKRTGRHVSFSDENVILMDTSDNDITSYGSETNRKRTKDLDSTSSPNKIAKYS